MYRGWAVVTCNGFPHSRGEVRLGPSNQAFNALSSPPPSRCLLAQLRRRSLICNKTWGILRGTNEICRRLHRPVLSAATHEPTAPRCVSTRSRLYA